MPPPFDVIHAIISASLSIPHSTIRSNGSFITNGFSSSITVYITSQVSDSATVVPSPGSLIMICLVKMYGSPRHPSPPLSESLTTMVGIPHAFTIVDIPSIPLNHATVLPALGISLIHGSSTCVSGHTTSRKHSGASTNAVSVSITCPPFGPFPETFPALIIGSTPV